MLLFHEVQGEFLREGVEGLLDFGKFRVVVSMNVDDFGEKRTQALNFLANVCVVLQDNVMRQFSERGALPIAIAFRQWRLLESCGDVAKVHFSGGTGLSQRFVAATTLVDCELLKKYVSPRDWGWPGRERSGHPVTARFPPVEGLREPVLKGGL